MQVVALPPISPLSGCSHYHGFKWWREGAKLSWRAICHPLATRVWCEFLNSSPFFSDLVAIRPRLVAKIYRPYHSNTMSCLERVAVLINHYRFIERLGWSALTLQAATAPVQLLQFCGRNATLYSLQLCAVEPMEREAELVLRLLCGDQLVYSCGFTFIQTEHSMKLGIACLQGPSGAHAPALIRTATRDLHGVRPKHLLIKLLSALGAGIGCKQMQLVSNRQRVVLRALQQNKVYADYDGFWASCGALLQADGHYQLACRPIPVPPLPAIASHRRSAARKRYVLLCQLSAAFQENLAKMSNWRSTHEAPAASPTACVRL